MKNTKHYCGKALPLGLLSTAVVAALLGCGTQKKPKTFVSIGTGGISGVYYPIGGAISKIVNKESSKHGVKASYESTGGSVVNINSIVSGDFDFGIAQADRQYQAINLMAEWSKIEGDNPNDGLRVVFSLHAEKVTLVASSKSDIKKLSDLRGKKVNLGNPGSGHRQNALDILEAHGLNPKKDLVAQSVNASEAPTLLKDGRIDAFFYTVGHPNGTIKEATAQRQKVLFVGIPATKGLLSQNPYYSEAEIDMSDYPNAMNEQGNNPKTIGVLAAFITDIRVPEKVVYVVTKKVFEHFEEFKSIHPALKNLTKESMTKNNVLPFHPGALKYFREAGLL